MDSRTASLLAVGSVATLCWTTAFAQVEFAVTRMDPEVHPTSGGTLVTLIGVGFTDETEVTIGSTRLEKPAVASSTKITAVTPALAAGRYDVTARQPGQPDVTLTDAIIVAPPKFPGVQGLSCVRWDGLPHIELTWRSPVRYESIEIYREKDLIATLGGTETSYIDSTPENEAAASVLYSVIGFANLGGMSESEKRAYPAECRSWTPAPRSQLIEFATLRAGRRLFSLRGSEAGSAGGEPVQTLFRVSEENDGVRFRVHGRRLGGDAQLRARILSADDFTVVCDDIPLESDGVLGEETWFTGDCREMETLPVGDYLLQFYAAGGDSTRTSFLLTSDAASLTETGLCGPVPLARVETLDEPKGPVALHSLRQLALHPRTAELLPGGDGRGAELSTEAALRNAVALDVEVSDVDEVIDRYTWHFSDGSEGESSGPSYLHPFLEPGIYDAVVTAYEGGRSVASLNGRVMAGHLEYSANAPMPGEPPTGLEMNPQGQGLEDFTLLSGYTSGITLRYLCRAIPANFARIDSVTLRVDAEGHPPAAEVVQRDVYHSRLSNGAWVGSATVAVTLPDMEADVIRLRATFTDTKGGSATTSERRSLCQLPAPFGHRWVREEVTGNPRDGFTVAGTIPARRPVWSEPVTIPIIGTVLDNRFDPYLTARLDFRDRTWYPQRIQGGLDVELLDVDLFNPRIIDIAPPEGASLGIRCGDLSLRYQKSGITDFFIDRPTCIPIVPSVPIWEFGVAGINAISVTASVSACIGFDVTANIDMVLDQFTPDAELTFRPSITASLPASGHADALFGLASLDIWLTPHVTFELPVNIEYQSGTRDLDYDIDWCLEAALYGKAKGCVFWEVCYETDAHLIFGIEWPDGCGEGAGAGGQLDDEEPFHSRSPAIACSPSGERAMMVYVHNVDETRKTLDPRLVYSLRTGDRAFSRPVEMFEGWPCRCFARNPSIAYIDEETVVAVWAQSALSEDDIPRLSGGGRAELNEILRSYDIHYSLWTGESWKPPQPLVRNDKADGLPVAASTGTGAVAVGWVQAGGDVVIDGGGRILLDGMSVWTAFIDSGGRVLSPTNVTADAEGLNAADIQPAIAFSPDGQVGQLIWVRDLDGDLRTPEDRGLASSEFVGGTWSTPEWLTDPGEYPGLLDPTLALGYDDTGVAAAHFPLPSAADRGAPVIDFDGHIIVMERNKFGFTSAPRILGLGTCGFEDGFPGLQPRAAFVDGNTAAVMFRPRLDSAVLDEDSAMPVLALATLQFRRGVAEISPVKTIRRDEAFAPAGFAVAPGLGRGLDVVFDDIGSPQVITFVEDVAPDLVVADIRFDDPHAPPRAVVVPRVLVKNAGTVDARGTTRVSIGSFQGNDFVEGIGVNRTIDLAPGETSEVPFSLLQPEETLELWVMVEPLPEEVEHENNLASFRLGLLAPSDLQCTDATPWRGQPAISLSWRNNETYDAVIVERDGSLVATLAGVREGYTDALALPGLHGWSVRGVVGLARSAPSNVCEFMIEPPLPQHSFQRGDANADGSVDISDPLSVLTYLFLGGRTFCLNADDSNDDDRVDISDATFSLGHLFLGGPPIPHPYGECGIDPTSLLECETFPLCGN